MTRYDDTVTPLYPLESILGLSLGFLGGIQNRRSIMDPQYEEFKYRVIVANTERMYELLMYIKWHNLDVRAVQKLEQLYEDIQGVLDNVPTDMSREE